MKCATAWFNAKCCSNHPGRRLAQRRRLEQIRGLLAQPQTLVLTALGEAFETTSQSLWTAYCLQPLRRKVLLQNSLKPGWQGCSLLPGILFIHVGVVAGIYVR